MEAPCASCGRSCTCQRAAVIYGTSPPATIVLQADTPNGSSIPRQKNRHERRRQAALDRKKT